MKNRFLGVHRLKSGVHRDFYFLDENPILFFFFFVIIGSVNRGPFAGSSDAYANARESEK